MTAAGRAIESVRASGRLETETKDDDSPVTRADSAANEILRHRLLALENIGWLSEESADSTDRLSANSLWVVDPLDGTKEFVEGVPQYSIAVGLVRSGEVVLGAIHCPPTGITTTALRGRGAFRSGERLHVAEGSLLLSSRSEMKRGEFEGFDDWHLEPVGSIALKMAMVGAGDGSVTLSRGPKWEWDVCAGSLIVEEAGGRAVDMFGSHLAFNSPFPKVRGILAGAPGAVERVLEHLKTIGPSDRMQEFA